MAHVSKKSSARKSSSTKSPARKTSAKRASATGRRPRASSSMTKQVKTTAMKVLAGAASGAVQALIPPLEEAAGRSAKSAGTGKPSGRERTDGRK